MPQNLSPSPAVTTKNVSKCPRCLAPRYCQMSPGSQNELLLRTTCLKSYSPFLQHFWSSSLVLCCVRFEKLEKVSNRSADRECGKRSTAWLYIPGTSGPCLGKPNYFLAGCVAWVVAVHNITPNPHWFFQETFPYLSIFWCRYWDVRKP